VTLTLEPKGSEQRREFSSPRGASSQLNRGSLMRRLIAVLVFCLLNIPVHAEDCVASVYTVGDSSQPGTKTASGIPHDDNAMTAAQAECCCKTAI